jgi:hypothetical protein
MELIHIKFLGRTSIKYQNGPVLPPAQVFYFNGQSLHRIHPEPMQTNIFMHRKTLCGIETHDLLI